MPACASSSPAFCMMYSAYKLNKQGDNRKPWRIPFPISNQSVVPCPVLAVASWPANRFLRKQVRWCSIPISLRIFQFFFFSKLHSKEQPLTQKHQCAEWKFLAIHYGEGGALKLLLHLKTSHPTSHSRLSSPIRFLISMVTFPSFFPPLPTQSPNHL